MKLLRPFAVLAGSLAAFALIAPAAQARASRNTRGNRNGRYSGPRRLIDDDKTDDNKRQDDSRGTKRADAPKQAPKPTAKPPAPKPPTTVARPATAPRPAAPKPTAAKPGTTPQDDEAREAEATKLREDADKALEQGTEESIVAGAGILREILSDYGDTDAASSAQQQLDLLLADPKLGPMILLAEAQAEFDAQHYRKARNKFQELLVRFPNSAQAADARARLAEIDQNDLLKKSVYTDAELEDARLWYLSGNIHLENGRKGDAASAYRKVIEEYPGCRYAVLAEEKLPGTRG
ncbi:MAG: tetratricopeptide repeat protein [Planctomycetes bacterium]|nr:tetratricopeptide repeat protein [Planctomycetota bacterium]